MNHTIAYSDEFVARLLLDRFDMTPLNDVAGRDLGFVIRTIAISRYPEHFSESELLSAAPGMRGVSDVDDRATSPLSSDPASPTSSGKAESRSSAVLPLPLIVCLKCKLVRASREPADCPNCGCARSHAYRVDAQLVSKGDF